jgi:hypothetical protein
MAAGDGPVGPPARIRPFLDTPSAPGQQGRASESTAGYGPSGSEPLAPGVRPFVLTSGRVRGSDPEIGLETQISARAQNSLVPQPRLTSESQAIVALCAEPISVAEVSARLRLHLGVTKILVGDLRAAGYLDVHVVDVASIHDPDTILRVMRGLRAIS